MKRQIRIAHTSDVHLDGASTRGAGAGYRNSAEFAFAKIVDRIHTGGYDLFIVAGDLYDHNRIDQSDVNFVRTQLEQIECPVIMIPGNHDVFDDTSHWHRFDPHELGDHVHPIKAHDGKSIDFESLGVRISGKAMFEHAPENEPLTGEWTLHDEFWNIGVAHGQVVEIRGSTRSSQISHAEIGKSGFDYLALGHVHVWEIFHVEDVVACYPGSPVAAFASSRGGYFASINLDPQSGVTVEKVKLPEYAVPEIDPISPLYS